MYYIIIPRPSFTLLGIQYDVDLTKTAILNYDKKLVKIKSLIKQWERRRLTPIGKLTLIKSLLISQLNHLFIALPNPSEGFMKELNTILFEFLWNSKVDKIKREIVYQNYDKGGLKMINLYNYIMGLKTTWIRRMIKNDSTKWVRLASLFVSIEEILTTGSENILNNISKIDNPFWKDVLRGWTSVNREMKLEKWEDFLSSPFSFNFNFRIDKKPIKFKSLIDRKILYVNDLIDSEGNFFEYSTFIELYGDQLNFLNNKSLIHSLRSFLIQKKIEKKSHKLDYPLLPLQRKNILIQAKGSK